MSEKESCREGTDDDFCYNYTDSTKNMKSGDSESLVPPRIMLKKKSSMDVLKDLA